MPKLVVITKGQAAVSHELGGSWTTVGRSDANQFQVPEGSVSGRHCEVRMDGEDLLVRDLCSTNGTFVDGKKITEGVLKPGQTLRLGDVELHLEASVTGGSPFNSKMLTSVGAKGPAPASSGKTESSAATKLAGPPDSPAGPVKKYQVLFVDDSLAFLDTFCELCSVLANQSWEIHTATGADRALALLQQTQMDLVVLDISIPMVDGIQLLGILHRRYPGLKIVVMTGKATDENRAACLAGGAELFVEKPVTSDGIKVIFNLLNDLVAWTHREGFSGTLRQVGLQEVVQMECNARHSSILEIRNQQMVGQIYIEAGVITHAAVGSLTGEKAVYRLLSFTGGEFQLKPFTAPPQRTVQDRWETLLMEAARFYDEETVLITRKSPEKKTEPPASPLADGSAANQPSNSTEPGPDFVVVATYDGKWNPTDGPQK